MKNFKLLFLIIIILTVKIVFGMIAEFIFNNPGTMAFMLLLAAGILAFTSFTAGLFITHLKFVRISSRN